MKKLYLLILFFALNISSVFPQTMSSRNLIYEVKENELANVWYKTLIENINYVESNKRVFYSLTIKLIDGTSFIYRMNLIDVDKLMKDSNQNKNVGDAALIVLTIIDKKVLSELIMIRPSEIKTIQIKKGN